MKLIGITGKTGTGKSTIGELLANKLNCKYVNIDKIGHMSISDADISRKIVKEFGNCILDSEKNIDRKKLGNIVFADKKNMDILTKFTWDYMQEKLDNIIKCENDFIIFDWALLPSVKFWNMCDIKILITSDDIKRKEKLLKRDNISIYYLEKREQNVIDYSKFDFDYVFDNNYSEESLNYIIDTIYNKLCL